MVVRLAHQPARKSGALIAELLVGMALLTLALLPLGYSIASEKRIALTYYHRAVAMEIVDGEMEVLMAGEWRTFAPGTHEYPVHADAAKVLPSGQFLLTIKTNTVRLEWRPEERHEGGPVVREARAK